MMDRRLKAARRYLKGRRLELYEFLLENGEASTREIRQVPGLRCVRMIEMERAGLVECTRVRPNVRSDGRKMRECVFAVTGRVIDGPFRSIDPRCRKVKRDSLKMVRQEMRELHAENVELRRQLMELKRERGAR